LIKGLKTVVKGDSLEGGEFRAGQWRCGRMVVWVNRQRRLVTTGEKFWRRTVYENILLGEFIGKCLINRWKTLRTVGWKSLFRCAEHRNRNRNRTEHWPCASQLFSQ